MARTVFLRAAAKLKVPLFKSSRLRQSRRVRWLLFFVCLTMAQGAVFAQEQENKMMERIMRPNMQLTNPAQNKSFAAVEGTSINKKFQTQKFNSGAPKETKSFLDLKSFLSKTFGTGEFARAQATAEAKTSADMAFAQTEFSTRKSSLIHTSAYQNKTEKVRDYSGQRPFLARGTRQKIFDQQRKEHPLTVEEVRELLNKN